MAGNLHWIGVSSSHGAHWAPLLTAGCQPGPRLAVGVEAEDLDAWAVLEVLSKPEALVNGHVVTFPVQAGLWEEGVELLQLADLVKLLRKLCQEEQTRTTGRKHKK